MRCDACASGRRTGCGGRTVHTSTSVGEHARGYILSAALCCPPAAPHRQLLGTELGALEDRQACLDGVPLAISERDPLLARPALGYRTQLVL